MNYQSTTLAKTLYKDKPLNADLMKKVLFLTLHGNCMEEMSVKQLSIYEKVGDKYQSEFNKRYDFVDLSNKRVYEFDGDQHFKYNEFFDNGDYSNFVKRRSADITKQNILVELGYDLVRVKGELTVDEFVDLLVALNLKKGQSVFIENSTYYQVIDTEQLLSELDQIELLQQENRQLTQEIAKLKAILTQSEDNNQSKDSVLSEFLSDIKNEFFGIRYISDVYLYERYKLYVSDNMLKHSMTSREFKVQIAELMTSIGYVYEYDENGYRKIRDFSAKTFNIDDCFGYMISLTNNQLKDKHRKQTYYELKSDYITISDFSRLSALDSKQNLNEFDQLVYDILFDLANKKRK